jgi:ABC-type nitrate/sulfonate/bicarbonate transport system permease component
VLAITLTPWLGKGHWLKAVIVAATSFSSFAEIFWGFRGAPLVPRILLAVDNALPYAFVGMLFGELWAATSGLGFFTIVARAAGNRTEALASALITLGLMVSVSFVLKLSIKWLLSSEPKLTQIV